MKTIEDVTERLITYLYDAVSDMLVLTEDERYEDAACVRDEIDIRIIKISRYIKRNKLSQINEEELLERFMSIKEMVVREITEMLQIPSERMIYEKKIC